MKKKKIVSELEFINERLVKLNCVSEMAQSLNNSTISKLIVGIAKSFSEIENQMIDSFLKSNDNGRLD